MCIFPPFVPWPKIIEIAEILAEDEANSLGRESVVYRIIALVVMAVSLSTDGSTKVDQKFDIEVSDERICVARLAGSR